MKSTLYLLFFPLLFLFVSCDNSDEAGIDLYMKFDTLQDSTQNGKQILLSSSKYLVHVYAKDFWGANIKNVKITSFDEERGNVVVLDTALQSTVVDFDFVYQVPVLNHDSLSINFEYVVTDVEQHTVKWNYNNEFMIVQTEKVLTEQSGVNMYAFELLDHPTGYSLSRNVAVQTSLSDSTDVDIVAYQPDPQGDAVACEWRTWNNLYFVKNNSFDYAKATLKTLRQTYQASVGYHKINNLQVGDIILVGNEKEALGVIMIQGIYDEDGQQFDRHVFNIKRYR